VKEIVRAHLKESALYGGAISGRGPRYCPSSKTDPEVPDAKRHQVFLEPEGLDTHELYVNGLSTSLPVPVQLEFLHAVPGLERATMTRPGYAIEYDYYPPTQLTPWLETKAIEHLFFAGQINGTTGLRRGGRQGVVAGINAVRRIGGAEPVILGRDDAYIGVLVDDLVTRGVDEPYRLFTSRSEFRLLAPAGQRAAAAGAARRAPGVAQRGGAPAGGAPLRGRGGAAAGGSRYDDHPGRCCRRAGRHGHEFGRAERVASVARRPGVSLRALLEAAGRGGDGGRGRRGECWDRAEIRWISGAGAGGCGTPGRARCVCAPGGPPYVEFKSLATEARRNSIGFADSLAQAARIPGVSPSDLHNLVVETARWRRRVA